MNRWLIFLHDSSAFGANLSLLNFLLEISDGRQFLIVMPKESELAKRFNEIQNCEVLYIPFSHWVYFDYASRNEFYQLLRRGINVLKGIRALFINSVLIGRNFAKFREFRPDLVVSNSAAIGHGATVAWVLRKRHLWHLREFLDLDYSLKFYFGKRISEHIIRCSDYVIPVSDTIRRHFNVKNCLVGFDGYRLPLIKNVTKNSDYTFLLVGLISNNKGHDLALQAFSRVYQLNPNCQLQIVGDGNLEWLESRIEAYDLYDGVVVTGYQNSVWPIYESAHCALMCSKNEALGRVTIESMICGLPVLAFRSGGSLELIEDGVNGFLFNDVDELASLMLRSIKEYEIFQAIGTRAKVTARQKFSMSNYSKNVLTYLNGNK
ncbi:MAG: glycosyltransferase [Cyclobacteriaceae bacterium]